MSIPVFNSECCPWNYRLRRRRTFLLHGVLSHDPAYRVTHAALANYYPQKPTDPQLQSQQQTEATNGH